jgi:predicted RNase H-like HicB family nuclease
MRFQIETEQEQDGRWIAEIPDLPGVLVYGEDRDRAVERATALALQVIAERIESSDVLQADAD